MSKTYSKAQNEVEKVKARERWGNYFVGRKKSFENIPSKNRCIIQQLFIIMLTLCHGV